MGDHSDPQVAEDSTHLAHCSSQLNYSQIGKQRIYFSIPSWII